MKPLLNYCGYPPPITISRRENSRKSKSKLSSCFCSIAHIDPHLRHQVSQVSTNMAYGPPVPYLGPPGYPPPNPYGGYGQSPSLWNIVNALLNQQMTMQRREPCYCRRSKYYCPRHGWRRSRRSRYRPRYPRSSSQYGSSYGLDPMDILMALAMMSGGMGQSYAPTMPSQYWGGNMSWGGNAPGWYLVDTPYGMAWMWVDD